MNYFQIIKVMKCIGCTKNGVTVMAAILNLKQTQGRFQGFLDIRMGGFPGIIPEKTAFSILGYVN